MGAAATNGTVREDELTVATPHDVVRALARRDGIADPYPYYARLRNVAPIYHDNSSGMYVLTRYGDCREVLTSAQVRAPDHGWHDLVLPGWRGHPAAEWCFTSLPFKDSSEHTSIRSLVNRTFTQRRVRSLVPSIKRIANELLDSVCEAATGDWIVDLQDAVGFRLPVAVMAELVGVPHEDVDQFRWLFGDILRVMDFQGDDEVLVRADQAMVQVCGYFTDLLSRRRAAPGDDLLSALLTAPAHDGSRISDEDLLSLIILLFTGGFETTTLTIGTGTHALLTHRDQFDLLRAEPSLAASAAEEVLRWDCVVQRVVRMTVGELRIGGETIPHGSVIASLLGAANRDPEIYPDPDRFDIRRAGARPLSFGGGPYGCLGYALAKAELELYFAELSRRFPGIELAGGPARRQGAFLRGIDSLPVSLGRPAPSPA